MVVFVARKGNPKNVKTWDDLLKKDVEVITPNPVTSGGARWNVMAAYGAQLEQGKSDAEGMKYVDTLLNKVPVQDKSARESLYTFRAARATCCWPTRTRRSSPRRRAWTWTTRSPSRRS